jgi:pimeloyl-ACP methyl ester carboxylesterase
MVVAHGFTGSWERPAMVRIIAGFARHCGVVALDMRGHGRSSGVSTAGDREVFDLAAAVDWARQAGYRQVITCGFSMGGAVAIRHAARDGLGDRLAAVISISAPSRWYLRDTIAMRRVHYVLEHRPGRLFARWVLRTRIDASGWPIVPESPREAVPRVAPTPLLIVHGDRDRYFSLEQATALAERAKPPCDVWIVPGFGHAESAMTDDLTHRIGRYAATLGCDGKAD